MMAFNLQNYNADFEVLLTKLTMAVTVVKMTNDFVEDLLKDSETACNVLRDLMAWLPLITWIASKETVS